MDSPSTTTATLPEWAGYFPNPQEITRCYFEAFSPSEAGLLEEVTIRTDYWERACQEERLGDNFTALVSSLSQYRRKVLALFGEEGDCDETVVGLRMATLTVLESLATTYQSEANAAYQQLLESGVETQFVALQKRLVEFSDAVTTWRARDEEVELMWRRLHQDEDADRNEDADADEDADRDESTYTP